jgi:hypothetical protein
MFLFFLQIDLVHKSKGRVGHNKYTNIDRVQYDRVESECGSIIPQAKGDFGLRMNYALNKKGCPHFPLYITVFQHK